MCPSVRPSVYSITLHNYIRLSWNFVHRIVSSISRSSSKMRRIRQEMAELSKKLSFLTRPSLRGSTGIFQKKCGNFGFHPRVMCTAKSAWDRWVILECLNTKIIMRLATKPGIWETPKLLVIWGISRQFGFWMQFLCILRPFSVNISLENYAFFQN